MAFLYQKLMTSTIEDSIHDFCSPYCHPERNQLGFCPTACIPFCYPICNRPFLNLIPPIIENAVIRTVNQQTQDGETINGYPLFPLFFLAMMFIGFSILCCYTISKFSQSCLKSRTETEEAEEEEGEGNELNDPPVSFLDQELEPEAESAKTPTGLSPKLINSITVFKFKEHDGFVEGAKCSVCLNVFQEDETLRLLKICGHAFHAECIDTWLKSHLNCPICRAEIASPLPISFPSSSLQQQNTGGDLVELKRQEGAETDTDDQ